MAQDLVQKYMAIQPVALVIIAGMGMPLADLVVCGLVSPCVGHLSQEDPKEVAAYVPNRSDVSGFLGTNRFRNGRSSLFQKVDDNARIPEELSCIGNCLGGDVLSNGKYKRLDRPAGRGYRIQQTVLLRAFVLGRFHEHSHVGCCVSKLPNGRAQDNSENRFCGRHGTWYVQSGVTPISI